MRKFRDVLADLEGVLEVVPQRFSGALFSCSFCVVVFVLALSLALDLPAGANFGQAQSLLKVPHDFLRSVHLKGVRDDFFVRTNAGSDDMNMVMFRVLVSHGDVWNFRISHALHVLSDHLGPLTSGHLILSRGGQNRVKNGPGNVGSSVQRGLDFSLHLEPFVSTSTCANHLGRGVFTVDIPQGRLGT